MRSVANLARLCGLQVGQLEPLGPNLSAKQVLDEPPPAAQRLHDRRLATAKAWIKAGLIRTKTLGDGFAADPAWDILLNVYVSSIESQNITATNAGYSGQVPLSTGLRWISLLEANAWLTRINDPIDKRLRILVLTPEGKRRLEAAFDAAVDSDSKLGLARLQFTQQVNR